MDRTSPEPDMNAISISIFAIVITASLALVAPVTHFVQHEQAMTSAHTVTMTAAR
jgi:hypothetical protein